jgi:hypothetical protein
MKGSTMKLIAAAALASIALIGSVRAQNALPYTWPRTVGTTQVGLVPFNPARKQLVFINPNVAALVSICPAVDRITNASIVCTLHGPGSIPILPYSILPLSGIGGNPSIPQAWNAISDTGGSALTILEWE